MSDAYPNTFRRSYRPVGRDVGPAHFEDACAGDVPWPGRCTVDPTPVRRGFYRRPGSPYLALQRLEDKKWISAKWGISENKRKARFYSLTLKGREQLVEKQASGRG
ncbi:MAG: helix-turn-helix transcriptional regulator [Silvibacterium sp.]